MAEDTPRDWLTVRLTTDELNELTRLAREKGYTRSDLVRLILREVGIPFARELDPTPSGYGYKTSVVESVA